MMIAGGDKCAYGYSHENSTEVIKNEKIRPSELVRRSKAKCKTY